MKRAEYESDKGSAPDIRRAGLAGRVARVLAMAIPALAAVFALSAAVARADAPKLVPFGTFESTAAFGVAVDQASQDVFVAGFLQIVQGGLGPAGGPVNKFDPSGNLLVPPSPFGGEGFHSGVAVSPTNGDVYVLFQPFVTGGSNVFEPTVINAYAPGTGALLSSFSVPHSDNLDGFLTAVQIATDSEGNVYVPVVPENKVLEYNPATCPQAPTPCLPLKTFTGGSGTGALKEPVGVAVDSSGNLWVADTGNNRIEELSPSDTPLGEITSEGVQAVALDEHAHVFALVLNTADSCGKLASPCDHLVEYSSTGAQLADVGAGDFGSSELGNTLSTIAVNDSTGRVYVTDDGKNLVWMFGPQPPTPPQVERELAVEVGTAEAKLGALVNPGGSDASYRFEYGTTSAYGQTAPSPEGDAGTGFTARIVWAAAKSLAPGTTYHYRVVVTSALGTVAGPDQTFTTETATQASCPNEPFRTGFSSALPDCRAYELVVPPNKFGAQPDNPHVPGSEAGEVESALETDFAATGGGGLSFEGEDVFPGSRSAGKSYVATRGPSGWSLENEIPPQNYYGFECPDKDAQLHAYSADLSKVVVELGQDPECEGSEPEPELASGQPRGVANLFVRDNTDGSYQLVDVTPPDVTPTSAHFVAASADLSHVVFEEQAKLTSDALNNVDNLYEWTGGVVRLVTVLPNGTPVAVERTAKEEERPVVAISLDGSRIFFGAGGALYARVNGTSTVQVDASQVGGSAGGGSFEGANANGSQVFFTDANRLTAGSTAETGKPDLFRYDFAAPEGERLTDLTVDSGEAANVQGADGVSEDGSYVYFIAKGVLPGSVANEHGEAAQSGAPNVYLWHGGATTFVTHANEHTRVSANGAFLAFESRANLTGYDNTHAGGGVCPGSFGSECPELFLYSAANNSLVCASCNPSGEAPASGASLESSRRQPHNLSDDGRLFFDSYEALLPSDTNHQRDVYEFEPDGVGSCSDAGGCVFLISTGTSSLGTSFIDASANGDDVFLREYQQLVPQAKQEEARAIYDVRVDGGFPEPAVPPACATADACRAAPAPQPPIFGAPASQTFSGVGNLASPAAVKPKAKPRAKPVKCRKGFVRRKGRCVRQSGRKAGKSAHNNRRTGK